MTLQRGAPNDHLNLVDAKGMIGKPVDYRDRYQMLGVSSVVTSNNDTEMHFTYASPGTAEFYRENGKFADGTVLVKDILATSHAWMTTGDAHWAKDTKHWFMMIKDEKGRFAGNPLWADGWGWALFKSDAPDKQVVTDTAKAASAATSRPKAQTGFTFRVIRSRQTVSSTFKNRSNKEMTHA